MLENEKRINNKKTLKEFLSHEKKRYGVKAWRFKSFLGFENAILFKGNYLLRKTEYYKNKKNIIMFYIFGFFLQKYRNKFNIRIALNTCEKGLKIMHIGSVLINHGSIVGKDCTFHINTALVAGGTNKLAPVLKNNIILGIGSVVVGGVTLQNNIAIGANAVVTKSFDEENITIAGVPAKKISEKSSLDWNKNQKDTL